MRIRSGPKPHVKHLKLSQRWNLNINLYTVFQQTLSSFSCLVDKVKAADAYVNKARIARKCTFTVDTDIVLIYT